MPTTYTVIRKALITEKGMGVKETEGTLVFEVAEAATKTEVKQAVEALFKVKVNSVRTANFTGKERRRGKFTGYRPDWKKAYVRLKAGEKMPDYVNNLYSKKLPGVVSREVKRQQAAGCVPLKAKSEDDAD